MFGFRISKTGSWDAARKKLEEDAKNLRGRLLLAIKRAALLVEREVKKGLSTGAPGGVALRPLSLSTILQRRKGSSRPLLDSGALLGSVTTVLDEKNLTAFVGVHRTAGDGALNVAAVHEFGTKPYAIKVTPGIRRLFLFLSIKSAGRIKPLAASTTVIHHPGVPARPFLRPALEAVRSKIAAELRAELGAS